MVNPPFYSTRLDPTVFNRSVKIVQVARTVSLQLRSLGTNTPVTQKVRIQILDTVLFELILQLRLSKISTPTARHCTPRPVPSASSI